MNKTDKRAAGLWSGGKDSCLACCMAIEQGYKVTTLINFYRGERSCSHGLPAPLIADQANAAGMLIIQRDVNQKTYEEVFRKTMAELKRKGIEYLICGDIYLLEHRKWLERVVTEENLFPLFPLWNKPTEELLADFIKRGFEAIIVATRSQFMGEEWLGVPIDACFGQKIEGLPHKVDACGERGEYHTLVTCGPDWPGRLSVLKTAPSQENDHCFLNIAAWQVTGK